MDSNLNIAETYKREYNTIKRDLVKLVVLNIFYLVALLGLYFTNQKSHYLDKWFGSILPF